MWSFVLTDNDYQPVGEILNAKSRRVAKPLSKLDTASLQVRLDNPLADAMLSCQGYLKAYRDTQLQFFGPIVSAEEVGNNLDATISINAVGVGWFLQKRLAGKSATGTTFTNTGRHSIANSLITTANSEGEMGISADGLNSGSSVSYVAGPYRPVLEVINDLANAFDGFEWRVLPLENFDEVVTSQKIGSFVAQQVLGQARPNAIFEWGTGRNNIASYARSRSRETQANKVYHSVNQGADVPGYPVISAIDAQSITDYKLLEDLASADLLDSTLRTQFVQEHVAVRRNPRETITFEPHIDPGNTGRIPYFGIDYDVGDTVVARAAYNGKLRFDNFFRVYGIEFDISDLGVEKAALTLTDQ